MRWLCSQCSIGATPAVQVDALVLRSGSARMPALLVPLPVAKVFDQLRH